MKKYLLILGNSPDLAKEELKNLVKLKEISYQPPTFIVETDDVIPFSRLGGAIKFAEGISDDVKLTEIVKTDFGISDYTGKINILKLSKEIKGETGKRFVLPQQDRVLSSVVVKKQKLTEIIFTSSGIFKTIDVQDFEDWGKRDYGRPQVQAHIGMLPPKVARMMVNLGVGANLEYKVLDPFCGVGTIAMEALEIGCKQVFASDIDNRQVDRTKENLLWYGKQANLFVGDAREISKSIKDIDTIVTEPYLGPNDGKTKDFGLEKMYLTCFTEWKRVLKPEGTVVIVLPSFDLDDTLVKNVIDKVASIGYILRTGPVVYARPQAKVKRNICVFKYGTH